MSALETLHYVAAFLWVVGMARATVDNRKRILPVAAAIAAVIFALLMQLINVLIEKGEIMKFRKKPVVVEAVQFDFERWVHQRQTAYPMVTGDDLGKGMTAVNPRIKTLEGDMAVSDGDYIIKGVQGEYYPCKPDIFKQTYEAAE